MDRKLINDIAVVKGSRYFTVKCRARSQGSYCLLPGLPKELEVKVPIDIWS